MSLGLLEVFLILPEDYFLIGGIGPGAEWKNTKSKSTHYTHNDSNFIKPLRNEPQGKEVEEATLLVTYGKADYKKLK